MHIKDITGPGSIFNVQNMNVFVMPTPDAKNPVVNPGVEYGEDGKAKWSPPLQQQLDTMKDAVGPTTDDPTMEPSEQEKTELTEPEEDPNIERIRQLAAIFTPSTNFPGG